MQTDMISFSFIKTTSRLPGNSVVRNHAKRLSMCDVHLMWQSSILANPPQISAKQAQDWCAARGGIPYFETSAKEGMSERAADFTTRIGISKAGLCDCDKCYLGVEVDQW